MRVPRPSSLVAQLGAALRSVADPSRIGPMRAYMKNDFVFLGVSAPQRRLALRAVLADHGLGKRTLVSDEWLTEVACRLSQGPSRELQYLAGDVLDVLSRSTVPAMLETVVGEAFATDDPSLGPWWDLVDHFVGSFISPLGQRVDIADRMRGWLHGSGAPLHTRPKGPFSAELAKVRSAILSQLGRRASTDEARLFESCAHRATDREFFVAKAVGWALRDYSYTAPKAVSRFVARHPQLTKLAAREALKAIKRTSATA